MNVFKLIEEHGLNLHGDIEHFAELVRAGKREWVSIPDWEIHEMYNEPRSNAEMIAFAREFEAKLKEKNT